MNEFEKWWGTSDYYLSVTNEEKLAEEIKNICKAAWNTALSKILIEASKAVSSDNPNLELIKLIPKISSMVV